MDGLKIHPYKIDRAYGSYQSSIGTVHFIATDFNPAGGYEQNNRRDLNPMEMKTIINPRDINPMKKI